MTAKKKTPEFGFYGVGDKLYQLAPFTTGRFEQVGALLGEIPLQDLFNAYYDIEAKRQAILQAAAGGPEKQGPTELDVEISFGNILQALQRVLPVIGKKNLLVRFVAIALGIKKNEAENLPAKVALEVVRDFFTANKDLLGISLRSSLPGMILARQVTNPPSAETTPQTLSTETP